MFSDQDPAPYEIEVTSNTVYHRYTRPRTISELTIEDLGRPSADELVLIRRLDGKGVILPDWFGLIGKEQ